jgi:uncharacterized protein
MTDSMLRTAQTSMASYLRNPALHQPPGGIEPRRLRIYQDLVYNNIEGFISGGFPVVRSLYDDTRWHALVGAFIDQHRCHTPYFLEIGQEFLQFVMRDYRSDGNDPPFLAELAHYEWVELALDVAEDVLPPAVPVADVLHAVVRLSPLAWSLRYQFPVHRIGPGFTPLQAEQPTYLVVYRDRADKVGFIEQSPVTARLLELVSHNTEETAFTLLRALAAELKLPEEAMFAHGSDQLRQLIDAAVVLVAPS